MWGTPVQAILDHKNLAGLAGGGGSKSAPEIAQLWLWSPPDSRGPKMNEGYLRWAPNSPSTAPDWFESIPGVIYPFEGLWRAPKPNLFWGKFWPFPSPPANPDFWNYKFKTSQELWMLSRSLSECQSLILDVIISVSQSVRNRRSTTVWTVP